MDVQALEHLRPLARSGDGRVRVSMRGFGLGLERHPYHLDGIVGHLVNPLLGPKGHGGATTYPPG